MTFAALNQALAAAGCREGQHHRGSGWSDWGDLVYEPPVAGYVVRARQVGWTEDHYPLSRWYVDHAGAGRRAALPRYLAALEAAGFKPEIAPLHELMKKQVVWVGEPWRESAFTL